MWDPKLYMRLFKENFGNTYNMPKVKIKKVPQAASGLQIEGNQAKPLSESTILLGGKPHSEGGTGIFFEGQQVEAEKGEILNVNNQGDLIVLGNLKIPGTNTKFKSAGKKIGEEEGKATRQNDKAQDLISLNDPYDKYEALSFNAGQVKMDAANQKLKRANQEKELLGNLQQMILDGSERLGIKPEKFEKTIAKNGATMQNGGSLFTQPTANPFVYQVPDWRTAQYTPPGVPFIPTPLESVAPNAQGTLAQRNNNPGNLRFANQKGATKGDKGFAKFDSYEAGYEALLNDLKSKQTGKTRTGLKPTSSLQDLINVYAPKADNNDPTSYANTVARSLGVTPNTPISGLDTKRLADAMAQVEDRAYAISKGNAPTPQQPPVQQQYTEPTDPTPYQRPLLPLEQVGISQPQTNIRTQYINPQTQQFQDEAPAYMQPAAPYGRPEQILPSLADRNRLNPLDFLPEIGAILDRPDYVQGQQYTPELLSPTSYSFQDQINQNASTFNGLARNFANNPEALAQLAAGQYQANQSVLGNEFRQNQQAYNAVTNQNNQILNSAELQNIQLNDQQYVRQSQAAANTDQNRQNALNSISNKYAQNRAQNNDLRMVENMFNYRPDQNMQLQNYNWTDFNNSTAQPMSQPNTPEAIALQTQQAKAQKAAYEAEAARQRAAKKNTNFFSNIFGRR